MARKNLIEISAPSMARAEPARVEAVQPRDNRPIAGFVPQERSAAPVGGITKTLGNITEKMERASELERQLAAGQTIIELDPSLIDASFVSDRLAIDAAELAQLIEQIREHGQQVPILVRPHPETKGRYQVAYGHRRLAAAREIGIRVRAVVRELTDGQLVVSQGQENSARTNLSYIERALFASRLEERSFGRDVIMAALAVDKAALSRMLIVIRQVPLDLVNAIGAAPDIGRRRWLELGERLEGADIEKIIAELSADDARKISSDERFHRALVLATKRTAAPKQAIAQTQVSGVPVMIKKTVSGATFVFDGKTAPGFDRFVQERLKGLFQEFNKDRGA